MRHNGQARQFPKIGMRNIKTAIAAALCAFVYYFFDRSPAFACIGAIFGMGSDLEMSKLHGGNRLFGTVIGGLLGMALFRIYLIFYPEGGRSLLQVVLVFIGTILLILLCQLFWVGGVQPAVWCCVFCCSTHRWTLISAMRSTAFLIPVWAWWRLWRSTACFPAGLPSRGRKSTAPIWKGRWSTSAGIARLSGKKEKQLPEDGEHSAE